MKTFKLADLYSQVLVLAASISFVLINAHSSFIYIYFSIGGWQVLSFLFHLLIEESWVNKKDRTYYAKTIGWILAIGVLAFLLGAAGYSFLLIYLFLLLIIAPVLAIWYFIIGISEWEHIKRKELIHLK